MDSKQWLALKASAGSGKTFALAMRYISLLFSGANPNEILTLTFTKKAATEMKKRISEHLINLKNKKNTQIFYQELKNYGISEENIEKNITNIYQNFLNAHTKITTIDAFLSSILRKFCWHAGVSKDYQVQSIDKEKIFENFILTLKENEYKDFLDFCFHQHIAPKTLLELIIALDFKDFEIQDYIQKPTTSNPKTSEILSIAQSIKNAIDTDKQASDRAKNAIKPQSLQKLTNNLKWLEEGEEYYYFKKLDLSAILPLFETLKEKLFQYYQYQEYRFLEQISKFLKLYRKSAIKKFSNTLSFDSITFKTYELLQKNFSSDFFYFRLDDKISHILIDEFQDTSIIQYKILKPLIDEIYAGEGRFGDRSTFFVGDIKQSIYGFRGSNSELFEHISKNISTQNLPYNYRSSKNVIEYVNNIFQDKFTHYIPQELPAHKIASSKGYIKVCAPVEEDQVFEEILKNLNDLIEKNIPLEQIAILCFGNDDVLNLKDYLLTQNPELKIITETNKKFTHQIESKIILNCFEFGKTGLEFYKKSAYKLAGLPYNADLKIPDFIPNQSPQKFILSIMETFGLYGKAAQKMLEISCDFNDIEEFFDKIERFEGIYFAPEFQKGLQIMTIHKSKGLEFEYVLICDRCKRGRGDSSKLIYYYEGIDLRRIFYKQAEKEKIDSNYQKAYEKQKEIDYKETINSLYVAFTRAKEGLIIIQKQSKKNNSKSPSRSLEILQLQPIEIGVLKALSIEKPKENNPTPVFVEQKDFGRQEDFIEQSQKPQISQPIDLLFGEALHKALEYELGYGVCQKDIYSILNNQFGYYLPEESIIQIFHLIEKLKKNEMFNSIISQALVKSEVSYLNQNALNRMDAIVLDKDKQVIILDYKSGISNQEEYQKQVKKYLEFTKNQWNDCPIRAYILYVREKIDFILVA